MHDEAVRLRLAELTPTGDRFNDWPSEAEIVSIHMPTSRKDIFRHGVLCGTATAHGYGTVRQIWRDQIPREVSEHLLHTLWNGHIERGTQTIYWMIAPPPGNAGSGGPYNMLGLIEPQFHWKTGHVEFTGMRIEIGCKHEMQGRNLGNCYNESRCQKCGYYFRIDSSD